MDLRQLRYFVTIAEAGGFAAASDLLDVGQPTLSRQIRALELDLKVSLFHRHGRGVVPTEAGQRFLRHAHHVLRAAEAALSELHEEDRRLQGRVVCGLTRNVGRLTIADFAQRFHAQLPLARVGIVNQLSNLLYDQVRAGKLDFAVVHNPPPSSRLSIVALGHQRFYLVGTRQVGPDPETVELRLLDKLPLAMPTGPHIAHPLELEAARSGIQLRTLFEIDAPDALFELVTRGCAHTVSTQLAIHSNWTPQTLVCQEIVAPRVSVNLSLVHPPLDRMTPLQKAATAIARNILSSAVDPLPASS